MKTTIMGSIHSVAVPSSSTLSSREQPQRKATTTVATETETEERNLHLARREASRLFSVIPAEPIVVLQRRPTSTNNKDSKKQQALMEMTTASICRHDVKSNNSNNGVISDAGTSTGLPIFPPLNDGISGATDPPSKDADYDRLETNHHRKHYLGAPSSSVLAPPTKRLHQNPRGNTVSRDTTGAKARRQSASSIKIHRRATTNRTANDNEEQKQLMKWYDMRTWNMFLRITEARKKQQHPYSITPSTTTTSTPRNSNSPTTTTTSNSGGACGPAPPHYSNNNDTDEYGQFMDPNTLMFQHDDHDHDESHFYYSTASSSDRNNNSNASLLEHEMIFGDLEE